MEILVADEELQIVCGMRLICEELGYKVVSGHIRWALTRCEEMYVW